MQFLTGRKRSPSPEEQLEKKAALMPSIKYECVLFIFDRLVFWTMILNTDSVLTYMATNFILFFIFWDNDDRQMPTG